MNPIIKRSRQICFQAARVCKDYFSSQTGTSGSEFLLTAQVPGIDEQEYQQFVSWMHRTRSLFHHKHLENVMKSKTQENSEILNFLLDECPLDFPMKLTLQCSRDHLNFVLADHSPGFAIRRLIHAAHFLPKVPKTHKCSRLHGHTFDLRFYFQKVSSISLEECAFHEFLDQYNHCLLNEIEDLHNPTSELFALHLFQEISDRFEGLIAVEVFETDNSGCLYFGSKEVHTFKRFDLQSANPLPGGNFEGYSYEMIPTISMPVHPEMGWTMDFAQLKQVVEPIRKILDHHDLSRSTPEDLTLAENLIQFLYRELGKDLAELSKVRLRKSRSKAFEIGNLERDLGGDFDTTR